MTTISTVTKLCSDEHPVFVSLDLEEQRSLFLCLDHASVKNTPSSEKQKPVHRIHCTPYKGFVMKLQRHFQTVQLFCSSENICSIFYGLESGLQTFLLQIFVHWSRRDCSLICKAVLDYTSINKTKMSCPFMDWDIKIKKIKSVLSHL